MSHFPVVIEETAFGIAGKEDRSVLMSNIPTLDLLLSPPLTHYYLMYLLVSGHACCTLPLYDLPTGEVLSVFSLPICVFVLLFPSSGFWIRIRSLLRFSLPLACISYRLATRAYGMPSPSRRSASSRHIVTHYPSARARNRVAVAEKPGGSLLW